MRMTADSAKKFEREKEEVKQKYDQLRLLTADYTDRYVELEKKIEKLKEENGQLKKEKEENEIDYENTIVIHKGILAKTKEQHRQEMVRMDDRVHRLETESNRLFLRAEEADIAKEESRKNKEKTQKCLKMHEAMVEAAVEEDQPSMVKCYVCYQMRLIDGPIELQTLGDCNHVACEQCVEQIVNADPYNHDVRCPFCRSHMSIQNLRFK